MLRVFKLVLSNIQQSAKKKKKKNPQQKTRLLLAEEVILFESLNKLSVRKQQDYRIQLMVRWLSSQHQKCLNEKEWNIIR